MNPKDEIVAIIKNLKDRLEIMERGVAGVSIPPAMPAGTVIPYAGSSAPTGYLICDGSAISRSTYSSLYAIIGTTYGAGDGSTTFNLPNLKGKTIVGYNSAETEFDALGETGGAKTHTLTKEQMPSHTHTQNAHTHTINGLYISGTSGGRFVMQGDGNLVFYRNGAVWNTGGGSMQSGYMQWSIGNSSDNQTTSSTTATNQNTGGGQAHNNLQPYITLNYIIKS